MTNDLTLNPKVD